MTYIQTWPLNIDFTLAVQNPQLCFADADLKQASTAKNSRGRVLLWSGNFATVYKLTRGGKSWAVRCFTRIPQTDVQQRYQAISEYLSQHQIPYLVDFEFVPKGILVKGEWYPILKMDWVEGVEIDRYIGENIDEPSVLQRLDLQLQKLQKDLRQASIAHGDLQHGNIMVDDLGELRLVDYDGMYVPALLGMPPLEMGHPNYQPPLRSLKDFGEQLDDFSFDVIALSLRALALQPSLWETFHEDNKNLIFRQNDFQDPDSSPVFQAIANLDGDDTRQICDRLILRCYGKDPTQAIDGQFPQLQFLNDQSKTIFQLTLVVIALVGGIFWAWKINQSAPPISPTLITETPKNIPASSPTPNKSASPIPSPSPQLTSITAETLMAKYAEGQRNFQFVQLTGNQSDRLQGQDFSNINLSGSVIERIDLRQVIFRNANLNGVRIVRVDLRGADLSNASLIEANLTASNLTDAKLEQSNLLRINLSQAKLGSANLQKTELMSANLSEADLNSANLQDANLLLANLRKANLGKANLQNSNLAAANLSDAIVDGADLSLADMRSTELYLTSFTNADLSSTNLTAANLSLVELAGAKLNGANLQNVSVENIGSIESADFTNVTNLANNVRQYFCSLASGNIAETGLATKVTLNCSP